MGRIVHTVSQRPFADRSGSIFRTYQLPGGTTLHVLDRAVFDKACAAANAVLRDKLKSRRPPRP